MSGIHIAANAPMHREITSLRDLRELNGASRGQVTIHNALVPESVESIEIARLFERAGRYAGALAKSGYGPGSTFVLAGPVSLEFITAICAILGLGGTFSVVPVPSTAAAEETTWHSIVARSRFTNADAVLVSDALNQLASNPDIPNVIGLSSLAREAAHSSASDYNASSSNNAVIQFTSGSTGDPRGVAISGLKLARHIQAISEAAALSAGNDILLSWMPLYHDMGLIGFLLTPLFLGIDLVLMDSSEFIQRPIRWIEVASHYRATVTGGPDFAYRAVTRSLAKSSASTNLASVRLAFNGAEPVRYSTVQDFCRATANMGFSPSAMFPVFGMAEATLAVSFPKVGSGPSFEWIDQDSFYSGECAKISESRSGQVVAKLGWPIPEVEIRIVDPATGRGPTSSVFGEVEIRGQCVASEYYRRPDLRTDFGPDGWFRTGDLGYIADDGQLVVSGRLKETIVIAGRNVSPSEVEHAAEAACSSIRVSAAFGIPVDWGGEGVVVVAEVSSSELENTTALRNSVRRQVRSCIGVAPVEIVVVPRHTIPRTSSGKVQRLECRRRYLERGCS